MTDPHKRYERRYFHFTSLLKAQTATINKIMKGRLIVFFLGALLTLVFYFTSNTYLSIGFLLASLLLFVYLVLMAGDLERRRTLTSSLQKINEDALKRQEGNWKNFKDDGVEFRQLEHPFSNDLDLFGRGSLYQWTNVTRTYLGRKRFAQMLKEPLSIAHLMVERQEAILELSAKLVWRQRFQAEGEALTEKQKNIEALSAWAKIRYAFYDQKWVRYLIWILPIGTMALILSSIFGLVHYFVPLSGILLQTLLLRWKKREHKEALDTIYPYKRTLTTYENMLKRLEKEDFKSGLIIKLKKSIQTDYNQTASFQINQLGKIADGISNRLNAMYLILDILFLWDFHLMVALEKWKTQTGTKMITWLEAIAEIEALNSLAVIAFDHPNWCLPTIGKEAGFTSKNLGHPLIGTKAITNSVDLKSAATLLITGSNMSGKSTLLRTVGINLILAYTGAPVCANQMSCGIMDIYTCMRVSDNLEENISSFYAELLRIKQIVSASKQKRQVFFLLDEVFKGTNSEDRHLGAKMLIKQLNLQGATGLVSTHDLELGAMEAEMNGQVRNYHFREYYENDQIHFDYLLRPGISTTKNALYLIKMAGIEVEE